MTVASVGKRASAAWLLALLSLPTLTSAQFACSLAAADESHCVASTADGGNHCVWCSVAAFAFCVSESQAQGIEQSIPGAACDRYSGSDDDDEAPSDDAAATDDGVTPKDDDVAPSDDALPSNYWKCLKAKNAKDCECTWCITKAGYGLCLSGPSAESAQSSDWYTCPTSSSSSTTERNNSDPDNAQDPYDVSCALAFLQDPTQDGCQAAKDQDGAPCEWCQLQGMGNICLTEEQADMGQAIGITCATANAESGDADYDDDDTFAATAVEETPEQHHPIQDPYDPSCVLAFFQDPTQGGCTNAQDADGNPCEWCDVAGLTNVCLTAEQAALGPSLGIACDEQQQQKEASGLQDPYDPSCALAFLQDPTQDGCAAAKDADGIACEFCNFAGSLDLCLTEEQANMGMAIGITCDEENEINKESIADQERYNTLIQGTNTAADDPYDIACALAFLQDPTQDGCTAAVDEDGKACEWCDLQGMGNLCLTEEQAQMGQAIGITCDAVLTAPTTTMSAQTVPTIADAHCLVQNPNNGDCARAHDTNGNPCERCFIGEMALCLTAEQADIGADVWECESAPETVDELLADMEDTNHSDSDPAADDPYDPSCAMAFLQNPNKEACTGSLDADGQACEYCTLNGLLNLCLTTEQAQVGEGLGIECSSGNSSGSMRLSVAATA